MAAEQSLNKFGIADGGHSSDYDHLAIQATGNVLSRPVKVIIPRSVSILVILITLNTLPLGWVFGALAEEGMAFATDCAAKL
jgi:hypothetical protein